MATTVSLPGGGKHLDRDVKKFSMAGTSTTETITTDLNRVIDYRVSVFPGTIASAFVGTVSAAYQLTLQGTVGASAEDGSFGYLAGTTDSNTLTFQRPGTAVGAVVYVVTLEGNKF